MKICKQKLIVRITNLFIISIFFCAYLFWNIPYTGKWLNEDVFRIYNISYKIFLYVIIFSFVCVNIIIRLRKFPVSLLIFSFFTIILSLILKPTFISYVLVFLAAYFVVDNIKNKKYSKSTVKKIVFFSLLFCCLQMLYFRSSDGRPVLSFIDPNFSAFYLFLLFVITNCLQLRLLNFICIILGLLTLSRAFLFAVVIFLVLKYLKIFYNLAKSIRIHIPIIIVLLSLIFVFLAGEALRKYGGNNVTEYDVNISRFVTLNDGSNRLRFSLNEQFVKALINSDKLKLTGVSREYYVSNYGILLPHNGFFEFVRINGLILAIIFVSSVFLLILNSSSRFSFPFIASYIFYMCFLPVIPAGISLLLVSIIYAVILSLQREKYVGYNCS